MQFVTNIYKRIFFLTCVIFITHLQLHAQKPKTPDTKGDQKTEFSLKKDSIDIKAKEKEIKDKFLKTFYDKISIKKYLRDKEKTRIINVADSLINKKIAGNSTINKQIVTIVDVLLSLNTEKKKIDTVFVHPEVAPTESSEEEKTDITIDQLADKLFPLIQEKVKDEENKTTLNKKLNIYRELRLHPGGIIDTLTIDKALSKQYTLKIAQRNEVFGFHPFWRKNYDDYHFELITTLAYYGYELNGKTGLPKNLNGWDSTGIVKRAQKDGCKVVLSVFCPNKADLSYFLSNEAAQHKFISTIIHCIKTTQKANGVNLMFDIPKGDHRHNFSKFVRKLSAELKIAGQGYELSITVPAYDEFQTYDIKHLSVYANKFIIDFSKKNLYGSLVPLTGNNYSLEKGIHNYLDYKVLPSKFLACMPFRGGLWDYETELFNDYIPYSKINELYVNDYGKTYDKNACAQRSDVVIDGDTLEQLWFDDPKTLGEKYDLILKNKMGGVAIWYLGDDHNDSDMWNTLVDKMVVFDSTDVVILKKIPAEETSLWKKIKKELQLYKLLFSHPCDFDQKLKAQMKADDYIGYVALGFLLLFIIIGLYTIAQRRLLGDDWKQNNFFLSTLIVLVMLVMISGLMFFFLNPDYTSFGHSHDDCETSFFTILQVLAIGFLIGLLAMRLLVFPLIKRKETP